MVRINLLPVKRSKKRDAATRELAIGGSILGVVLISLYVWYAVMESKLQAVNTTIARTTAEIKRIEQDIVKVDEFKRNKRELEQKLAVIEDLKAKKTGPVKLLDELALNLPKRVWLTSFEEKGGAMLMEGGAADNDELSDFLSYLTKRTKYFSGVQLLYSEVSQDKAPAAPVAAGAKLQPVSNAATPAFVKFKISGNAVYGSLPLTGPSGATGNRGGK
jgi:type IV pilus assembly protein PilN